MADTLRKLVDMELDDESKADAQTPIAMPEVPDYPYGLRITFSEVELEKLELDPDEAETGAYFTGCFRACITSVSKNEVDGKVTRRIEAQIEELAIDADNLLPGESESGKRGKSVLYDHKRKRQEADDEGE